MGVFYDVYNELGHGFRESTYAEAMVVPLESLGLAVSREVPFRFGFEEERSGSTVPFSWWRELSYSS